MEAGSGNSESVSRPRGMSGRIALAAALLLALLAGPAVAQDAWPARPVKIIVPSFPGGGTDLFARLVASALSEAFKQSFVVENRPGASGNIGAEAAAKSAPDGYTLLVSASPALVINPSLYKILPYHAERDFVPVARGVISPLVFCVLPSSPAKTLADLVELGRREPGKLTFGSAGMGSTTYLGVRMLEEASGAKFLHIPYKGMGQAYQGLLGGQISFMLSDPPTVAAQLRAGRIRALAATYRMPMLPETPTLAEAGYPHMDINASFMVAAPAGTPAAIVQRLNEEINKAMKSPANAEKLNALGVIPVFETPEQFAGTLARQRKMWADFIHRTGIAPE